ncbi:MAG: hypothetical protein E2O91_00590 [Alphaproteobacteria bacterium]|nr:MAG: hypothetical protein E2O91_00590 [Alphaproteobacteria bacterium]
MISVSVIIPLSQIDTTNPAHISGMIQQTVRLAVPWLFVAFAASSLVYVFPNNFSKWIARNRRIFGLCFAAGMAWQLFFILWLVIGSFDYYMAEAYSYYDLSEQIPGYIILFAMTFTSFKFGRSMLSPRQWKFLHKGGIYFIWAVVWSTYWFELYFYDDIQPIDYAYYWMGIAAWGMRLAAWTKKRRLSKKMKGTLKLSDQIAFGIFTGIGLFLIFFGNFWTPLTPDTFSDFTFGGWAALFVPFLILVPLYTAALVATPARG